MTEGVTIINSNLQINDYDSDNASRDILRRIGKTKYCCRFRQQSTSLISAITESITDVCLVTIAPQSPTH